MIKKETEKIMQPSRTCHSRWSMACTEVTDETSLRVTCASVV